MYVHQASVTGLSSLRVRCTAFYRTVMMIRSCSIDRVIDSQWTIVSLIIAASGSISTIYKRHPIAIFIHIYTLLCSLYLFLHLQDVVLSIFIQCCFHDLLLTIITIYKDRYSCYISFSVIWCFQIIGVQK